MFNVGRDKDTICALSTAAGRGGISVIRVSGSDSDQIVRRLCPFLPKSPQSHTIYFGTLEEPETKAAIDEVLVLYFADGKSYTGERTLEISCHGNPVLVQNILELLVRVGCRPADRGEFTYRAFMNGRIDLVQAESVLALIESQTKSAARVALRQLKGRLSHELGDIEEKVLWCLARLEASIDFSTEDIQVVETHELDSRITAALEKTDLLLKSYEQGRLLREGLKVILVGRPNVGKSSLLNSFLKEEKAIVTEIAGTTRDLLEGVIQIGGHKVSLIDTAGLRNTNDPVEKIGVQRAISAVQEADLVLYLTDLTEGLTAADVEKIKELPKPRLLFLGTKSDLFDGSELGRRKSELETQLTSLGFDSQVHIVSSISGEGLSDIESVFFQKLRDRVSEDSEVLIHSRHQNLLINVENNLRRALGLIREHVSEEFIALELMESLKAINEILGKEVNEQVIDRIFRDFCIGK